MTGAWSGRATVPGGGCVEAAADRRSPRQPQRPGPRLSRLDLRDRPPALAEGIMTTFLMICLPCTCGDYRYDCVHGAIILL